MDPEIGKFLADNGIHLNEVNNIRFFNGFFNE